MRKKAVLRRTGVKGWVGEVENLLGVIRASVDSSS